METNLDYFQKPLKLDIHEYSPLTLAFIGDGVYELYIRAMLVGKINAPVDMLHKKAVSYVKASAQGDAYDRILPHLTEQEITMFKRGRNAKVNTKAKNAGLAEYKKATGFETLLGYLFVTKQNERLYELLEIAVGVE